MEFNGTYPNRPQFIRTPGSSILFVSIVTPMSVLAIGIHTTALYFLAKDDTDVVPPIILMALSCVEIANASFNVMATMEPFYGIYTIFRTVRRCFSYVRILHIAIMHLLTIEAAIKAFYGFLYDPVFMNLVWKISLVVFVMSTGICIVCEALYSILSSINTVYIIIEVLLFLNLVITYSNILRKLRRNRIQPPVSKDNMGHFEPARDGAKEKVKDDLKIINPRQVQLPSTNSALVEIKRIVISIPFLILITHIPFITIPNFVIIVSYKYAKMPPSFSSSNTAILFNSVGILINACLNLFKWKALRRKAAQYCCGDTLI